MAKKKETFSFIEQPRWHEGSIHNDFVPGKKTDYAIQLLPTETLPMAQEFFAGAEIVVVVHMPLGVVGAAPYRALEYPKTGTTPNLIAGIELWYAPESGVAHFAVMADGLRVSHIKRRRSPKLAVKIRKPFMGEAIQHADALLLGRRVGDLELHPDPAEVPTRAGRMWMWSERWRELHADPEWLDRPEGLYDCGDEWYMGSHGSTDISFQGVVSK